MNVASVGVNDIIPVILACEFHSAVVKAFVGCFLISGAFFYSTFF